MFSQRYSILLVSSSDLFNRFIISLLPSDKDCPISVVNCISKGRRYLLERTYDLIIINAPFSDGLGTRFAIDACTNTEAGVLFLVQQELYEELYEKVLPAGVFILPKPIGGQMLFQSLRMLCATRERLRRREEKQATVEEKIEEIRLVNRAKWLLIEHLGMTEVDAHKYIEKQSMNKRISKRKAAENIIKTYQK